MKDPTSDVDLRQGYMPSQKVMQAIGMHHDSADDFDHPRLAIDHPLRHHVLYRITRELWLQTLHG